MLSLNLSANGRKTKRQAKKQNNSKIFARCFFPAERTRKLEKCIFFKNSQLFFSRRLIERSAKCAKRDFKNLSANDSLIASAYLLKHVPIFVGVTETIHLQKSPRSLVEKCGKNRYTV